MRNFAFLALCIFLYSCGQQVAPTGGPKDSLPPKLVSSIPEYGAKNFKGNKISLIFDEYISLDNPFEKLVYSPTPKNNPNAEGKLKIVTIKLKDTLEENTTYHIDFGKAIKDINENNALSDFSFTFSTGDYIDSSFLTGRVWLASTGKTDSTLIAVLHRNLDDSAVTKEKPRYYTKLKGDGSFLFRNLKPGTYNLFAIKDADGGKKYDQASEMFAFLDKPLTIGADTTANLYAFEQEVNVKTTPKPSTTPKPVSTKKDEDKRLLLANNLESGRQDLLANLIISAEHTFKTLDSSKIFFTDKEFNPLPYQLQLDSTRKNLIFRHHWIENTTYNLILEKGFATDSLGKQFIKKDTINFNSKKESDYGSMDIRFENIDSAQQTILLLERDGKNYLKHVIKSDRLKIKLFPPGEYQVSILKDNNKNGKWDSGNYWKKLQPEIVISRKQTLTIRPNWDNELRLNLSEFYKQ